MSVVVVNWNSREWLDRCLRALSQTPHQIIVVDNASTDGSAEMVRQSFPAVTLVESRENLGFAGGVNRGRLEASTDRLLILNPDIHASAAAIERLAATLASDAGLAAVAGRLVNSDGTPQVGFTVRRLPTVASLAADLLLVDHLWPSNPLSFTYYARDLDLDASQDVEQPAAACLMVTATAFDRIGGMDTRFHPAWFEDVDFCRRLGEAGYRLRYEPAAIFVHRGGVARDTLGPQAFSRTFHVNMVRYVEKHHGTPAALLIRALVVVGMAPRAMVAALRGDWSTVRASAAVARDACVRPG